MYNKIIDRMIKYNSPDVRRINHALKVFTFAHLIAEAENCDSDTKDIVCISAILHDIGIHIAEKKYNSSAGKYQEIEGPQVAESLISDINLSKHVIDRILYITGSHHTYSKIDNTDFQIVVEADFLVNIDEDKIQADTVNSIREKIFKTDKGKSLLNLMYT